MTSEELDLQSSNCLLTGIYKCIILYISIFILVRLSMKKPKVMTKVTNRTYSGKMMRVFVKKMIVNPKKGSRKK